MIEEWLRTTGYGDYLPILFYIIFGIGPLIAFAIGLYKQTKDLEEYHKLKLEVMKMEANKAICDMYRKQGQYYERLSASLQDKQK
jgi:hypothetical protein